MTKNGPTGVDLQVEATKALLRRIEVLTDERDEAREIARLWRMVYGSDGSRVGPRIYHFPWENVAAS